MSDEPKTGEEHAHTHDHGECGGHDHDHQPAPEPAPPAEPDHAHTHDHGDCGGHDHAPAPEAVGAPVPAAAGDSAEAKPTGTKPAEGETISPLALAILVGILALVIYSFTGGGTSNTDDLPQESDPTKLLAEGNRIAKAEGLKQALPYFVKAVKVDQTNLNALAALGNVLLRLQRAQEALGYLQMCADREPDKFEHQLRYGMCLADLKKFPEARAALERAKTIKPDDLDVRFRLGFVCLMLRDYEATVANLEPYAAKTENPTSKAIALQLLSDALQNLGKRSEAIAALTSLTHLRPTDVTARLALQRQRISVEGFQATVTHAEARATAKEATPLDAYLIGTLLASHPDRSTEAKAWLEKAVAGGEKSWLAPQISLAQEEMRDDDLDAARKRLDGVIKLAPNNLPAKVLLANLERKAKRYDEARGIYEGILQTRLAPLALTSIVNTFLDEGKAEEALAFANRAPAGEPRLVLEGQGLQATGKFDEAIKVFQGLADRAQDQIGLKINCLAHLTYVCLDADRYEQARKTFAEMESIVPKGAKLPPQFYLWAGVAFQPTDPKRAKDYWTRGAATEKDYDQHAWKRRACALLAGSGKAEALLSAARLGGWEVHNDAHYAHGLALEMAGDRAGAKAAWTKAAEVSRQSEFPARLIRRALEK